MGTDKIVLGLAGAGRIGKMHAENILSRYPEVRLKTVVDPVLDEEWAKTAGIEVRSSDIKSITEDPEIKAVVITTPSSTHAKIIHLMAGAGKQIFCEKPIAFDPAVIAEAVQAVEEKGLILQVGFNRRFDADFLKVRQAVANGTIGEPHIISITNRDPRRPDLNFISGSGGLFMDFCVHDFDMARYLTGSDVEEIFVRGACLVDPEIAHLGDIDTAVLTLKMASGALCVIDVCRETNYGYDQQVEVFGSCGSVKAGNRHPTNVSFSTENGVLADNPYYSFIERYKEAYITELGEFFSCLKNSSLPSVGGRDAMKAVEIAAAARRSFETNQAVRMES